MAALISTRCRRPGGRPLRTAQILRAIHVVHEASRDGHIADGQPVQERVQRTLLRGQTGPGGREGTLAPVASEQRMQPVVVRTAHDGVDLFIPETKQRAEPIRRDVGHVARGDEHPPRAEHTQAGVEARQGPGVRMTVSDVRHVAREHIRVRRRTRSDTHHDGSCHGGERTVHADYHRLACNWVPRLVAPEAATLPPGHDQAGDGLGIGSTRRAYVVHEPKLLAEMIEGLRLSSVSGLARVPAPQVLFDENAR